ncbi:MAG: MFS transporter [Actinomycetota bacterium]
MAGKATGSAVSSPLRLALTGAVGFFVLGIVVSVLGPTLPELRSRHGLDATGGATLLAAFSVGSAAGVALSGFIRHRYPAPRLLSIGALCLAVGCAGVPFAPNGPLVACCLLFAGLGFGMFDVLLNLVVATAYGRGSGAVLSATSAAFGASAVLTPLLVGRAPRNLALPYLVCAVTATALLVLTTTLRTPNTSPLTSRRATRRELRVIVLLGSVLLGYVAFEGGVSSWETTYLRGVSSMSAAGAANAVALFWLGLTVGRLVSTPLALHWHPARLVLTSLALATCSVLVATNTAYAVAAFAVTGLLLAPVFPAVITWQARVVPSGRGATRVFAAGLAGPIVGAPILGLATDASSAAAVPWVLAAFGVAATSVAFLSYRLAQPG